MTESESNPLSAAQTEQRDVSTSAYPSRRALRAPAPKRRTVRQYKRWQRVEASRRPAARPSRGWRQHLSGAGVMLIVVGFFAALTLPSYAGASPTAVGPSELAKIQSLEVGEFESASADSTSRETYGVISAAEVLASRAVMLRRANLDAYLRSGAADLGDDYPWYAELTRPQGGGLSPLRYYYRECVDFVAWRLNVVSGVTSAPFKWNWSTLPSGAGNAYGWKSAWQRAGWPHGTTPHVGDVAYFPGANHVAFVSALTNDGGVLIEEYNYSSSHAYNRRIIAPGDAYYLSLPG